MYESPITILESQVQRMQQEQIKAIEGEVYRTIYRLGIEVDKEELLRALKYDRDQYQKGYTDRDKEIVHCAECRFLKKEICPITGDVLSVCAYHPYMFAVDSLHYCGYGERLLPPWERGDGA